MHSDEQAEQAIDELTVHIHTALRDGGLEAEPVLELASLLEACDVSTPATRELQRPAAHRTPADLTRLGRSLLTDINFEPSFTIEPRLWTTLEHALEVVKRDVRAGGITDSLRLATHDCDDRRLAWVEFQDDYHGNGIPSIMGSEAQGALAAVAEAVQETIMALVWTVWPVCKTHNRGLHAGFDHGAAVWRCNGDGAHTFAPVGRLP
ncbi:MAG: hypothetical protein HOV96_30620 [Nonomuraea sp.]|nr:hypothetical protein [Streptomyces sp.]NUP64307.1 hypothetical protein [Nonomuraea sp.]NUP81900.1 hypothetical protein [Nonomuraea sp.]